MTAAPAALTLAFERARANGGRLTCEWSLTNTGDDELSASVYLTTAARLTALAGGRDGTRVGRFHGESLFLIPPRARAIVGATLGPVPPGPCAVRVTVLTRDQLLELVVDANNKR